MGDKLETTPAGRKSSSPQTEHLTPACMIHCVDEPSETNILSCRDWSSWQTLLNAAKVRDHEAVLQIAATMQEDVCPTVYYHRECRARFTLKRDLQNIVSSKSTIVETDQPEPSPSTNTRVTRSDSGVHTPKSSRVYSPICIFCDKASKYKKGSRTREVLIKCDQLRSDATVRARAIEKNDSKIINILSRELVAAEGHYHRSCYRNYTRPTEIDPVKEERACDASDCKRYDVIEAEAYKKLFIEMRELFNEPKAVSLSDLRGSLKTYMREMGISEIKESTRTHMLRKIQTEFGESMKHTKDSRNIVLIFPDNLNLEHLVKENENLKYELKKMKSQETSPKGDFERVALGLRTAIKCQDKEDPWPPLPSDLKDSSGYIPDELKEFLHVLLTGNTISEDAPVKMTRAVESLGQDIVYMVSNGKRKPPKQIMLPFAVKSLTGNVELIKILNRLGHSISYSQLMEIDTALCLNKLSLFDTSLPIPERIHPHLPTTLGWDNIDRLEETLSGRETSHRVNGVAIQRQSYGPFQPSGHSSSLEKSKKRSVTATQILIPEYNAGERVGPLRRQYIPINETDTIKKSTEKNLLWLLARLHSSTSQTVSSWTGFNIQTRDNIEIEPDNIGYLPTINSPATELKTVHEVLTQSVKIKEQLQLPSIVVVFDQALYAKATDILWKHPDRFKGVVPRIGVFHTLCTLLGIIGKRFGDAGLKDLCIESGVLAEGSVAGVLEGRKYNRAIRFHKLMYEALMRLAWKGFLARSVSEEEQKTLQELGLIVDELCDNPCGTTMSEALESSEFSQVSEAFCQYLNKLREKGDLAYFWMTYIDIVEIILNLLRSSREGNWALHLQSMHDMIPWCFSYDNINYARYLAAYYSEMSHLSHDEPEIHQYMEQGGFSVQMGTTNTFGKIPVDQTVEETVNKDTQTQGGTKGFSLKPGAVSRYYLTAEYRSSYLRQLKNMVNISDENTRHADLSQSRIERDETDVQKIIEMLEQSWIDPFNSPEQDLVSLSTGTLATPDVAKDLKSAEEVGRIAYRVFRDERIEPGQTKKFHDPIKKQRLKTFTSMKKKKVVKTADQNTILTADRNLFAQMILIAQTRQLDMEEVFCHPLGPIPWSLASADGTLRKTAKSSLTKEIFKNVKPEEELDRNIACVIDGMALLQRINGNQLTFAELSNHVLSLVMAESRNCDRVDLVFDVYRNESIKNAERVNRGAHESTQFKCIAPGHTVQQWRTFLKGLHNKKNLVQFFVNDWCQQDLNTRLGAKQLYVTCEETCYVITENATTEVIDLKCSHEEADTRMLLHAKHASISGYKSVIMVCEDTDITVLCLANASKLSCKLIQKRKLEARTKYIDISKVANSLGEDVCEALPGLHSFTGCDTVSSFAGKGKLSALKLMKSREDYQALFKQLGIQWHVTEELFKGLQAFTCSLYSSRTSNANVNELGYFLFCAKGGELESWQLPPCAASLYKHCLRANYQCAVWRRCLEPCPEVPSPVGHGWCLEPSEDNTLCLAIDWNDVPAAPDAVLELLTCSCSRSCKAETCPCIRNKLEYAQMCSLKACTIQREDKEEYMANNGGSDDDTENV